MRCTRWAWRWARSAPVTVIGSSLFGWPSIIAVIVNYIYRSGGAAPGSSRISTGRSVPSGALAWALLVGLVLPLTLIIIGFGTWALGMFMLGLWAIYRITRGWLRLNARQPMRA